MSSQFSLSVHICRRVFIVGIRRVGSGLDQAIFLSELGWSKKKKIGLGQGLGRIIFKKSGLKPVQA